MRRLPVLAAFLLFQAVTMAQQPAGQPATSPPAPKAPKMASDDVMALLEKGEMIESGKARGFPKVKPGASG